MSTSIEMEKIDDLSKRMEAILQSRPVLRLFQNPDSFLLRYGQSTDIEPSLSVKVMYTDIVDADNDKLREIIIKSIPSKEQLSSDIDVFIEKQKLMLRMLHNAADSHEWDEVQSINSSLKWISSELKCLRVTLCSVVK